MDPDQRIKELEEALASEKRKNASLSHLISELKHSKMHMQVEAEQEEEMIVNRLVHRLDELVREKKQLEEKVKEEETELSTACNELKEAKDRVEELKKEKETLAALVEKEEQFVAFTLQKKLDKLKHEKVDLENQLEQEQEYITNKLQKRIEQVLAEKRVLEQRLEEEHKLLAQKDSEKERLKSQLQDMQNHIEEQQEYITNKLQKKINETNLEHKKFEERVRLQLKEHEAENEGRQRELLRLQNENYFLNQRIKREAERLREMSRERTKLFQSWEMQLERSTLENLRREESFGQRRRTSRSMSLPSAPDWFPVTANSPNSPFRLRTPPPNEGPMMRSPSSKFDLRRQESA